MTTLYDLHKDSKRSFGYVLEVYRRDNPDASVKTTEAVAMIVRRGTDRTPWIRALAKAWNVKVPVVEAAAQESRRQHRERERNKQPVLAA